MKARCARYVSWTLIIPGGRALMSIPCRLASIFAPRTSEPTSETEVDLEYCAVEQLHSSGGIHIICIKISMNHEGLKENGVDGDTQLVFLERLDGASVHSF